MDGRLNHLIPRVQGSMSQLDLPVPEGLGDNHSKMAAPFIKRFFQSLPSSRFLGTVRDLNCSTKHQLNPAETGRRSPKTAFFLGFGLAGLLGFSGILYGKKQRKTSLIEASFVEKKSEEKENNSPLQISVSLRCNDRFSGVNMRLCRHELRTGFKRWTSSLDLAYMVE